MRLLHACVASSTQHLPTKQSIRTSSNHTSNKSVRHPSIQLNQPDPKSGVIGVPNSGKGVRTPPGYYARGGCNSPPRLNTNWNHYENPVSRLAGNRAKCRRTWLNCPPQASKLETGGVALQPTS